MQTTTDSAAPCGVFVGELRGVVTRTAERALWPRSGGSAPQPDTLAVGDHYETFVVRLRVDTQWRKEAGTQCPLLH